MKARHDVIDRKAYVGWLLALLVGAAAVYAAAQGSRVGSVVAFVIAGVLALVSSSIAVGHDENAAPRTASASTSVVGAWHRLDSRASNEFLGELHGVRGQLRMAAAVVPPVVVAGVVWLLAATGSRLAGAGVLLLGVLLTCAGWIWAWRFVRARLMPQDAAVDRRAEARLMIVALGLSLPVFGVLIWLALSDGQPSEAAGVAVLGLACVTAGVGSARRMRTRPRGW